ELGPEDDRSIFRYNGSPAVAIGVVRQSKANLIDVARNIREALPSIQQALPPGVKLQTAWDGSVFVTHSINDARLTLLIAAILVVLIIFVFLRNVRATIIPGLAIPASIIAAFAIMYFLGFSINNFTLLALTIAIGIVVDDAIIVLENAFRHQEELHETPEQAAVNGTNEIGFAVIATTIALVAVFTPLAFLTGTAGRLLSEFGIADAAAERADPGGRSRLLPGGRTRPGRCVAALYRRLRAARGGNHRAHPRRKRVLHDRRRIRGWRQQRVHRRDHEGLG